MRWIGRQVGPGQRFRIIKRLGERPLIASFRGADKRTGEAVVVRILDDSLARDRALIARLEAEVELQSAAIHQSLIPFAGHFRRGDSLALHRRYVEGANLSAFLKARGTALEWRESQALIGPILEVLWAMHEAGLCHLGVSASNVVLEQREVVEPRVVDAGVRRVLGDRARSEADDAWHAFFVAPEVAGGSLETSPRADVFAAGALLTAMLAGPRAVAGAVAAEVAQRLAQPLPTLLGRALTDRPSERYAHAGELLEAVRELSVLDTTAENVYVESSSDGQVAPSKVSEAAGPSMAPEPVTDEATGFGAAMASTDDAIRARQPVKAAVASEQPGVTARAAPGAGAEPLEGDVAPTRLLRALTAPDMPEDEPRLDAWSKTPTARTARPGLAEEPKIPDDTPPIGVTVETPREPLAAIQSAGERRGLIAPSAAKHLERGMTAEREAAAELGAFGALNDEDDAIGLPPRLTTQPSDGSLRSAPSTEQAPAEDRGESREIRSVPRAVLHSPPTANVSAVSERSARRSLVLTLLAAVLAVALIAVGLNALDSGPEEPQPPTPAAAAPSQAVGPGATTGGGASVTMPESSTELNADRVATAESPAVRPADVRVEGTGQSEQRSAAIAATPPAPERTGAPARDRPAPDAARESGVAFSEALWAEGNVWVMRRTVDAPVAVDDREYYVRREVTASRPHPWGTRVTLVETGGNEEPRLRDLIASAACLIDPASERIDLCLPARSDELQELEVAGAAVPVFRTAHGERDVVFGPSLGWIESTWWNEAGDRVTSTLVGWELGGVIGGDVDHPTPTCSWAHTGAGAPGIGRTDRPEGPDAELTMVISWGIEGRMRRLDVPLGEGDGSPALHAWYSRYETAYLLSGDGTAPVATGVTPLERVALPLERVWVWTPPDGTGAEVAALAFEKDGQHAVHLVTRRDDGSTEVLPVLGPSERRLGRADVRVYPGPGGCSLQVVQTLEGGERRFATFELSDEGPLRLAGDL